MVVVVVVVVVVVEVCWFVVGRVKPDVSSAALRHMSASSRRSTCVFHTFYESR